MSVNPKTLVEKFIKDSKGRSRLAAATSVLAVFTVLITVGVLTFPAISLSGSEEALQEQGIDITVGQEDESSQEVVAPPADEAPIVAYDEASQAPDAESNENVAEAITEDSTIGDAAVSEGEEAAADAPAEGEETAEGEEATETEEGEEGEEELDPEKEEAEKEIEASKAAKNALAAADLSSARLIVGSPAADALAQDENVVASFDNIYLLQYTNTEEAAKGFLRFYDHAEYVTPDVAVAIADDIIEDNSDPEEEVITTNNVYTEEENPFAELEAAIVENEAEIAQEASQPDALIAVIDTGAAAGGNVVEAVSMVGTEAGDDNGHGQRMVRYIVEENEAARILSIKALGKDGKGDVSAVVAAINYAVERGANIINLSASAYASEENAALADAVKTAESAGVVVVGAAGNNGFNAKYYIPGNIEEATIVGASDELGVRIVQSNFGATVDYNVAAGSTSEAAARMSGFVSAYGEAGIAEVLNQGLIFETGYVATEEEEEAAEEAEEAEEGEEDGQIEAADGDVAPANPTTVSSWTELKNAIAEWDIPEERVININGTLQATEGLKIKGGQNIKIVGGTIKGSGASLNEMFWVNGGAFAIDGTTFSGENLNVNKSNTGTFVHIDGGNLAINGATFKNLNITDTEKKNVAPIRAIDTAGATRVTISGATFENNVLKGSGSAGAIIVKGLNVDVELTDTTIQNNATTYPTDSVLPLGNDPIAWLSGKAAHYADYREADARTAGWFTGTGDTAENYWANTPSAYQGSKHARNSAGAITIEGGSVAIKGSTTIQNNKSDVGGVLLWSGTLTQDSGTSSIKSNTGFNAGAVSIISGVYNLEAGTIESNRSAWFGSVNVSNNSATFNMGVNGGTPVFENNYTLHKGGAIYVNSNTANLVRGKLLGNSALIYGGAIYVEHDRTLTMVDAVITDNYTDKGLNDDSKWAASSVGWSMGHGGGYWSCASGRLELDTNEVAIYNNRSEFWHASAEWSDALTTGTDADDFFAERYSEVGKFTAADTDRWIDQFGNLANSGQKAFDYHDMDGRDQEVDKQILAAGGFHRVALKNTEPPRRKDGSVKPDNEFAIIIKDNHAPNGGGIASNGLLSFTRNTERQISAKLQLEKTFVNGSIEKPVKVRVTVKDANGEVVQTQEQILTSSNGTWNGTLEFNPSTILEVNGHSVLEDIYNITGGDFTSLKAYDENGQIAYTNWSLTIEEFVQDENGGYTGASEAYTLSLGDLEGKLDVRSAMQGSALITYKNYTLRTSLSNDEKPNIKVIKLDEDGGSLQGAGFALYRVGQEEAVQTIEPGDYSEFSFDHLDVGDYYLVESPVPAGYDAAGYIPFSIDKNGDIEVKHIANVTLDKDAKLSLGGSPLYADSIEKGAGVNVSNTGSQLVLTNIHNEPQPNPEVGKEYYIYAGNNGNSNFYMQSYRVGDPLDFAVPGINNEQSWWHSSYVWTWVELDGVGNALYSRQYDAYLMLDGTTVKLGKGEPGSDIALGSSVGVTSSQDGKLFTISVNNEKKKHNVKLIKRGEGTEDADFPGATFSLYNSNGVQVGEPQTGGEMTFTNLKAGNYYFVEQIPPIGYEKLEGKIHFNIALDANGTTTFNGYAQEAGVDNGYLTIGGKRLYASSLAEGAEISTTPSKYPLKVTTNYQTHEEAASLDVDSIYYIWAGEGDWHMQNRKANPHGKDVNFAGMNDNQVIADPGSYPHHGSYDWKVSIVNGVKVLECPYYEQDSTYRYLYLDDNGTAKVSNAEASLLSTTGAVTASSEGSTFTITATDAKKRYFAKLIKKDNSGNVLPGATFRLYYTENTGGSAIARYATKAADGSVSETWVDSSALGDGTYANDNTVWQSAAGTGEVNFTNLKSGTYYVEEVAAPTGYIKLEQPIAFVINEDGNIRYTSESFISYGTVTISDSGELFVDGKRVSATANGARKNLFLQNSDGTQATELDAGRTYIISEANTKGQDSSWYVRAYDNGTLSFDAGKDSYENGPLGDNARYFKWVAEDIDGNLILRNQATGKYLVNKDDMFKHVDRADALQGVGTIEAVNNEELYSYKLFKTNGADQALPGATFRIYYLDGAVKKYLVNNNGSAGEGVNPATAATIWTVPGDGILEFGNLTAERTYFIEEVAAPEGYSKFEGTISFALARGGAVTHKGVTPDVTVSDVTGQLSIGGEKLYASVTDGEVTASSVVTTTPTNFPLIVKNGYGQDAVPVTALTSGTYWIQAGDSAWYFINQAGNSDVPVFSDMSSEYSYERFKWNYVVANGVKALQNQKWPRQRYLKFDGENAGFVANIADLTLTANSAVEQVTDGSANIKVANAPRVPYLRLYKTDMGSNRLKGATFYIRELGSGNTKGERLAYLTEVSDGIFTFDFATAKESYNPATYSPNTKYVIWEESAPTDYVASGLDIVFTIDRDGVINLITNQSEISSSLAVLNADTANYFTTSGNDTIINVKNEQKGEVKIEKLNTENEAVVGAVLQILNTQGTPVVIDEAASGEARTQWTTDGNPKTIKLPAGTYKLHEKSAPSPYQPAADMEFTLSSSNVGDSCISLVMYDPLPGEIVITKVDHQGQGLAGAVLQILDANKELVVLYPDRTGDERTQWISDGGSFKIPVTLSEGTYYIHEKAAPEGYSPTADQKFVVKDGSGSATTAFGANEQCAISIDNSSIPKITISHDNISHTGYCLDETRMDVASYTTTPVSVDNLPDKVPNKTNIESNKEQIAKVLWLGYPNDKAGLNSYYANRANKPGAFSDEKFTDDDFRIATQAAIWYYTNNHHPYDNEDGGLTNIQMAAALAILHIVEGGEIDYVETGEENAPHNKFDSQLSAIINKTYTYPSDAKLNVYYSGDAQPVIDAMFPSGTSAGSVDYSVVNTPKLVDLEILKKWYDEDGNDITASNPQYKGKQFTEVKVTLKRTIEGDNSTAFTQELTITKEARADYTTVTIDGLEYEIEDTTWGLKIKGLPAAVNVNKEAKKYIYTITESVAEGFTTANASPVAVVSEDSGTYTFTLENNVITPRYEIDLIKVDTRDLPAIRTAVDGMSENSQAAIDAIKAKAEAGKGLLSDDVTFVLNDNNVNPAVEKRMVVESGVIKFKDLKPGNYTLQETRSPKQYQPNKTIWHVVISDAGEVSMTTESNTPNEYAQIGKTGLIAYGNDATTYTLPATGGVGTQVFVVLGGLLMLAAGASYVRRAGRANA